MDAEVERRYRLIREAAEAEGLDAVVAAGSEYTGFEGAVLYLSGFDIVHRYCYVLLPLEEEPTIVFPSEARYVGEHDKSWISDRVFVDRPGEWMRDRARERGWKRVGLYGLDYIATVRDYTALAEGPFELVGFDREFDIARRAKSEAELESVRRSVWINEQGLWAVLEAYEPGKTEAEIMAPAQALFTELGCGRKAMNMVLAGAGGGKTRPEFKIASHTRKVEPDDLLLYSLEIAGPGGHWAEVSRPIISGEPTDDTKRMMDAYREYHAIARETLRAGNTAHDVHMAVSKPFVDAGWKLGHVTGHSIGMTMIEHPRIGEGVDVELLENMVCSMHPHVITQDGETCLYFQDTWLVAKDAGESLAELPVQFFDGSERPA